MNKDSFIKDVVLDWSYKIDNGQPDVKNEYHLQILYNILEKKNIPTEVIKELLNNLRGHKDESITQTDRFYQDSGLHSTGSYYEPSLEKNEIKSYYYDPDWNKVVEGNGYVSSGDIIVENEFICPESNDVFLETKKGTLARKSDIDTENEKNNEK